MANGLRQWYTDKRTPLVASGFALLVICLTFVGLANASAISRQMHAWKLLPEPERLTELYFTDHAKLPNVYAPGDVQTVAFTIHNLEYRTQTYHYVIRQTSQDGSRSAVLGEGDFRLPQDGYARPAVPVTLSDFGRSQISIQLSPSNESIHYWVNGG